MFRYRVKILDMKPHLLLLCELIPFIALISIFSTLTYQRNILWKNELILWGDIAHKSPLKPRPHVNLGNAYDRAGLTRKAIIEHKRVITLAPDYAKGYLNLGVDYYNLGKFDEALALYKTALNLNPENTEVHYNIGLIYHKQGKLKEALTEYRKACAQKFNEPDVHFNMGTLYGQMGRIDESIKEYKTAIELAPEEIFVYYHLGKTYLEHKKDYDKALLYFKKGQKVKPNHPLNQKINNLIKMIERAVEKTK